ncbi:hypothetical protein [Haloprofundus salinisoli]|uniref:hypothetical protein n=1 Tax=Haloprofundus salinisoli TaxID=2876193 RepID=UPI001CCC4FEB|nr:hypothetical protein [Haloprofundus salinisoli]
MADLDSCYFCGEIGDGLTELAVVPPRFAPTDNQQRTVVLCTTCRRKLGTVLEPVVDVLGGGEAPDDPSAADNPSAPDTSPPSPKLGDDADAADAIDTADAPPSETGPESDPEPTPTAPPPGDAIDTTDFDDPLAPDAEGVTIGTPVTDETDDGTGDAADTSAPDSDESDDGDEPDGADTAARDEEPAEFRTVMRLLSNRQFPVDRAEIESLASGAYDLDDSQVRDILDYAVDRGVLAERNGQLHRD